MEEEHQVFIKMEVDSEAGGVRDVDEGNQQFQPSKNLLIALETAEAGHRDMGIAVQPLSGLLVNAFDKSYYGGASPHPQDINILTDNSGDRKRNQGQRALPLADEVLILEDPNVTIFDIRNPMIVLPEPPKNSIAIGGPNCWYCNMLLPCFTCQKCDRSFHRKCCLDDAIRKYNYPEPEFNVPLDEVLRNLDSSSSGNYSSKKKSRSSSSESGSVVMVKCQECLLAETTLIREFRSVPQNTLQKAFLNFAKMVENNWMELNSASRAKEGIRTSMKNKFPPVTVTAIFNTIQKYPEHFRTIEGLLSAYKLMMYQAKRLYGKSETTDVIRECCHFVEMEIPTFQLCCECYLRRYDQNTCGKLLNMLEYKQRKSAEEVCVVPHPLIWVKLSGFGPVFWPAKLYVMNNATNEIVYQCFDELAVRVETLKTPVSNFRVYSTNNVNRKKCDDKRIRAKLNSAIASCSRYIINLRNKFEVVLPDEAKSNDEEPFETDFNKLFHRMFPEVDMDALFGET